jgi:hypothetical protein
MAVATIVTVLVVIVLAAGVSAERERRRHTAAAYQAAGLGHTPGGNEPGMPRRGYASTHGYAGGSFDGGRIGAFPGGERVGNENIGPTSS